MYNPRIWYDGDIVTSGGLNNIEQGIAQNAHDIEDLQGALGGDMESYVDNWLDSHPEVTTTVQDGSLTANKFNESVDITNNEIDSIIDALGYYNEITYIKERNNGTDCYIVTIPKSDSNGNIINPFMGFSGSYSPNEYARQNGTTLTFNAGCNMQKTDGTWIAPNFLSRGTVLYSNDIIDSIKPNDARYIDIKADRTYNDYPIATPLSILQSNGAYNIFHSYYKLVENAQPLDLSNVTANEEGRVTDKNPNLAVGIKSDLTIIVFCCDGRTAIDIGLTSAEVAAIMVDKGCIDAWMLDGGGSASVSLKGSKLNKNIDDNGITDRMIRFTFNIKKGE